MELAGERIQFDQPMALYTTLGVGGRAEALWECCEIEELQNMIRFLNSVSVPYLVVGRGSNLLVRDEGLEGVVIVLRGPLEKMMQDEPDKTSVLCAAGVSLSHLLAHCKRKNLGGLEFLAGIPGTVGGAAAMNAGAFGKDMGSSVMALHVIDPGGELIIMERSELMFSYRVLAIERGAIIVRVRLKVHHEDSKAIARRITHNLKKRQSTQPLTDPSAGSVFKNPPNDYAGRLIEQAGLKGKRIGGAQISPSHANYIVNKGEATATEVLALMQLAQCKVKEATGVALEPEIRIVGR
jgi:UDP-N-acetylmuramate dehydrogenase